MSMENETYQDLEGYPKIGPPIRSEFKERYFTPSIEDIHVGYECEFLKGQGMENQKLWQPLTIKQSMFPTILRDYKFLRVPYLTKEQIEAEGWIPTVASEGYEYRYKNYYMYISKIYNKEGIPLLNLGIENVTTQEDIFLGECKDINTFRYISKLLNI